VPEDEVEQRLLALDVQVDRSLGDAKRFGDVRHLRPAIALIDEDSGRGFDQIREARLAAAAAHGNYRGGRLLLAHSHRFIGIVRAF
jgi:hypothetical protein